MSNIKIIEGTATEIEEAAKSLEIYDLFSLEFAYRSQVYLDDGGYEVSDEKVSFYVAVFKHV